MNCLKRINHFILPNKVVINLNKIYQYIGKEDYYNLIVSNDIPRVVDQTIERDCYFLAKILNLNITDNRMRLIITKNSTPRSVDESTLFHIKAVLTTFQKDPDEVKFNSGDLINMINYIYSSKTIKYTHEAYDRSNPEKSLVSKRFAIDELNNLLNDYLEKEEFEKIYLYIHYFIDFYNEQPFANDSLVISYLLLLLFLLKSKIHAFKYISLFELIYNDFNQFKEKLADASFNWKEGYAQTMDFTYYLTCMILEGCKKADIIISDYKEDKSVNKADNIENTIENLPRVFTKDDIRRYHPYVSESTINRALSKLRDENAIRPLGKGRTAKWVKTNLI